MERALRGLSPQSYSGSLLYALLLHGLTVGIVMLTFALRGPAVKESPPEIMDLGYQTFDEPPPPEKEVRVVKHSVATPSEPVSTMKTETRPQEMQDEKSDVSGTQKAAPVAAAVGNEGTGTAEATPYYKIKPKYPREAMVAGKEGWVLFKIDVNEEGAVENVRVVDGVERNTFTSEARRAVLLWKYKPFLNEQGKPFKKIDHQVRVDFKLRDSAPEGATVSQRL